MGGISLWAQPHNFAELSEEQYSISLSIQRSGASSRCYMCSSGRLFSSESFDEETDITRYTGIAHISSLVSK
jgi:hypothetical protein